MASNKLYGLPDRIELETMRDVTTKQKTESIDDHGHAIYMNTMALAKGTSPSVEDKDHDYEILHHKFSPPKRNMPAEKNLKQRVIGKEYRCVFIVFGGLMGALFFMVTGIAVALGVLHKTGVATQLGALDSMEPMFCLVRFWYRKRNCSIGDSKMGFIDCVGDASEYQLCKESPCNETYSLWSTWEQWSSCSASCDVGMRQRRRNCNEISSRENAVYCIGDASEYQLCNERACSVNGWWGSWSAWGQCSSTCNTGVQLRQRACSNPRPTNGGDFCRGDFLEHKLCYNTPCSSLVIDGGWNGWLAWGSCSTTCGTGFQFRQRTCSSPKPRNGGEHCFGEGADYRTCKLRICPGVNGGWSVWSSWGTCSTTCEAGIQTRHRTCSNPQPGNGGEHCFGESADYRSCNLRTCPAVNGGWSAWASWGSCSATCGTGLQSRQRNCSYPRPSNGGEHCFGESADYRSCHLRYCSVSDGYWSSWSSWSSCSSTCTKTRTRYCTTYTGGRQCLGNSLDQGNCNLTGCALTQLQIRLVGSYNRGRLEVSLDGSHWGTVCDDHFNSTEARVACRMLGYTGYSFLDASSVPDGSGPIYLDDLDCDGTESSLLHCIHNGWSKHNCQHSEDVGVSCY